MPSTTRTRSPEAHTCPRCGMWRRADEYSAPHARTSCTTCEAQLSSSALRPCRRCHTLYPGHTYPVRGTATVCSQCAGRNRSQRRSTRRTESAAPTWLTRRFGVELEFRATVGRERVAEEMRARGLAVRVQSYGHNVTRHWRIITDASCGYELVSPVLQGADGLDQLQKACDALKAAGAKVDRATGLHIHLDGTSETQESIRAYALAYVERQELLDILVAPSRRQGRGYYCRPMDSRTQAALRSATNVRDFAMSYCGGERRYRTLNLASYPRYGTVEVRQHQGTTEGAKVADWVELNMRLWDAAKAGRTLSTTSTRQLLTDLGMDEAKVEHWMRRARALRRHETSHTYDHLVGV